MSDLSLFGINEMLQLMGQTLDADDRIRAQAESHLDAIPFLHKASSLLQHLSQVTTPDIFQHILIYVRRLILNEMNKKDSQLNQQALTTLKNLGLKILADSIYLKNTVKNKVADLVLTIFEAPTEDDTDLEWPELSQFIIQSTSTNDPAYVDTFFKIVSSSPIILDNYFTDLWPTIKSLVTNYLNPEQNNSARASSAINAFLQLVEFYAPGSMKSLKPITELILKDAIVYINSPDAIDILKCIESASQSSPKLFSCCVDTFCQTILSILKMPDLEDDIRIMAIECFVELTRSLRSAFTKREEAVATFVNYCITFIATMEDHGQWVDVDVVDHIDENTLSFCASIALERISVALGGIICAPVVNAISHIPQDNWKIHAAVLIALTSICEGSKKQIKQCSQIIVAFVLRSLAGTQNPILLNCALDCISEISLHSKKVLMKTYHADVYNTLLQVATQTAAVPRCQSKAYQCISAVSENCPRSIMLQYAGAVIENCIQSLKMNMEKFSLTQMEATRDRLVINACMALLSTLAENMEEDMIPFMQTVVPALLYMIQEFAKYQEPFSPHVLASLKNQMSGSGSTSNASISFHHLTRVYQGHDEGKHFLHLTILLESLKTITQIHYSVHEIDSTPQEYVNPILDIVKAINIDAELHIQGQEHLKSSYFDVISNVCAIFGDISSTLLPVFMPLLLNAAAITPEVQIYDKDENDSTIGDDGHELWEDIPIGYKEVLRLRTDQLEDKDSACKILAYVMEKITSGLLPYAESILTLLTTDLLKFALSTDVRISAIEMLNPLLKLFMSQSPQSLPSVWAKLSPIFISIIASEKHNEVLKSFAACALEILSLLGNTCFNQEQLSTVSSALAKRIKEIILYLDKQNKSSRYKNGQSIDDNNEDEPDEQQLLDEDDERLERICIMYSVQSIQIAFFTIFRDQFYTVACGDQIPMALELLKMSLHSLSPSEISIVLFETGVITLSNVIEYCSSSIFIQDPNNFIAPLLMFLPGGSNPQISIQSPDPQKNQILCDCRFRWSLLQASIFSLGLIAEKASQSGMPINAVEPYIRATSRAVFQFLSQIHYNPFFPPNEACISPIDNCVSCLGRILRYTPNFCEPSPEVVLQVWSSYLPVMEDEHTETLTFYIQLFKQNPASFLGPNLENLDGVLKKIVLMSEYVDTDLNDEAVEILLKLNQQYPEKYNAVVSGWEVTLMESLKYVIERSTKHKTQ